MRRRAVLAAVVLLGVRLAAAEPARAPELSSGAAHAEMDRWLMAGLDDIYRMKLDLADQEVGNAQAAYPEHPYPYLGQAALAWVRYVYLTDRSDQALLAPFDARLQQALAVGDRWLAAHPNDGEGLLVQGAAYGMSSRLLAMRKQWIKAYYHGRKALGLVRAAAKADPALWDARLGTAMYDYYSDLYPRFIGVLARLVLRGDRDRAIRTLHEVAEKGHFARNTAQVLLIEIYTEDPYGARDPEKALALVRGLRERYPESPLMHWGELLSLYSAGRYEDVIAGADDFIAKVGRGFYEPLELAKGYVVLGCAEWARGEKKRGLEAFRAAQKVDYQGRPSRWAVWAHVRAGQLEDALAMRQDALADYKAVLAQPDTWEFYKLAKAGLSRPFAGTGPGAVTPP